MDFEKVVGVIRNHHSERAARWRRYTTDALPKDQKEDKDDVPWSWVAQRVLSLVAQYPSGLTEAILYSELEVQWDDCSVEFRKGVSRKFEILESVTDGKMIGPDAVFEVTITASSLLPQTRTRIFTLADESSKRTVDMYLHQKFYFLTQGPMADLLNQRSIRFTGTRSVTTKSITRLLPTELMIYLLSTETKHDLDFLQGHFTSILSDLDTRNPPQEFKWIGKVGSFARYKTCEMKDNADVWRKVIQIGTTHAARNGSNLKRLNIFINDTTSDENVCLVLWDDQIPLASLCKKGDWLAIWHPYIDPEPSARRKDDPVMLQYGSETVLFCLPEDGTTSLPSSQAGTPSQNALPRDDMGLLDYRRHPSRLRIAQLTHGMINISLFGRVTHLERNHKTTIDGMPEDRYGVRLADETGTCDITLTGILSHTAARFQLGQWVLLENLKTTATGKRSRFNVVGNKEIGTRVWNVSTSKGILSSPFLREIIPLQKLVGSGYMSAYCRATITGWKKGRSGGLTYFGHGRCRKPLETREGVLWCDFCQQWTEHNEFVFGLGCVLDDGTASCAVEMGWGVADDVLGVSAAEFQKLGSEGQQEFFWSTIGVEVECCVTSVPDVHSASSYFRIDALHVTSSRMHDLLALCDELT